MFGSSPLPIVVPDDREDVLSLVSLALDCEYEADSGGSRPPGVLVLHRNQRPDRDAEGALLLARDA